MFSWVLLLCFFFSVDGISCPSGYSDDENGSCQSARRSPLNQLKAYVSCGRENSYMTCIVNAFDNSRAIHSAGDFDNIWLGLTCASSSKNSCLWDNGIQIGDTSFTNFAPGHPNINKGACVYLSAVDGGLWYSASCSQFTAPFICKNTPKYDVPLCIGNAYYYRGHCYFPVKGEGFDQVEAGCEKYYANLASIHNIGEDSYARDVAISDPTLTNTSSPNYAYIGMQLTSSLWMDNTTIDYQNFGYKNANLGNCVFISTTNDAVPQGKWINSDCMSSAIGVCKRNLTDFPEACVGQEYFNGEGDLFSPSFPSASQGLHCEYVFNPDTGNIVTFTFVALSLDVNSTIKFYNTIFDRAPFVTLTNGNFNNQTYYSAGNLLKVVYDSPANGFFKNFWVAAYGEQAQGPNDCGGNYTKTGKISGPDIAKNCIYTIRITSSVTKQSCLRFIDINLQPGDTISIYDGPISPDNQIAFVAKGFTFGAQQLALCSIVTDTLNLVTSASSGLDYEWFTINVAGFFTELNPVPLFNYYDAYQPVPDEGKNASYLYDKFTGHQVIQYNQPLSTPLTHVRVNFTYLNMPYPQNTIVITDGPTSMPVAMAYGLGGPFFNRTTFPYTLNVYMGVAAMFNQVDVTGQLVGYVGMFHHS